MNRIDVINLLILKYQYRSYLEIGVNHKTNCFDKIQCERKISVDPSKLDNYDFNTTSDQFFGFNKEIFDIIFIDGLHTAEQAERDILNSLNFLSDLGKIVVHDTNPPTEFHQLESQDNTALTPAKNFWNGTVWKAIFNLRKTQYNNITLKTYDFDWGITIISKGASNQLSINNPYYSYSIFNDNRIEILNIVNFDE